MLKSGLGKYRNVVISIALFLIFDLGVLVLNFVISSQIASDALNVNLAGRQRMLSQRIAKTSLQIERLTALQQPVTEQIKELKASAGTFDRTLHAFRESGATTSGAGDEIQIEAIPEDDAQRILAEAMAVWSPLNKALTALTQTAQPTPEQAADVARQAEVANLKLLKLMNDLTTRVEATASDKATTLRMVQVGGITLATLNFVIILFHFIGHLRKSDRELEKAQRETADILRTTQDGLFLLDSAFCIGGQHSKALSRILGREQLAGMSFTELLRPMVNESTLATAREYLELLLNHDVKEKLVTSLNPLQRVEAVMAPTGGQAETRYLEFHFNRVLEGGVVTHLLVTVNDITRRIRLEKELAATEARAKGQLGILVEINQVSPGTLKRFLSAALESLNTMNNLLMEQDPAGAQNRVHALFRVAHRVKGDADAIGLKSLAETFHRLEDVLSGLRERSSVSGEDFLPVTVQVKELFEQVQTIESAVNWMAQVRGEDGAPELAAAIATRPTAEPEQVGLWREFAAQVAERRGNEVELQYTGADPAMLAPPLQEAVITLVNQFIRNAVTHGVEAPDIRLLKGKPRAGRLTVHLSTDADGALLLSFRDDGVGLSVAKIRQSAVASGRLSEAEAASWSPQRLASLIFEPGVSTAATVDGDAGRGAGLDAVKAMVEQLGGKIRISSTPNESCRFLVTLQAAA